MKEKKKWGIARISSSAQAEGLATQIKFLEDQGCSEIWTEVLSGKTKRNQRPELNDMLERLEPNTIIITKAIDRIARSLNELTSIVEEIKKKGAFIQIVEQNIDTSRKDGTSELLIGILGAISSWELQMRKNRCRAGIDRCLKEKRKYGRPSALTKNQEKMLLEGYRGGMSYKELASSFSISRQSVYNRVKAYSLAAHC